MSRELTREERAAIRSLVTRMCANYDSKYGCLPLDCPCYMLGKYWTGAYCKYFEQAVLPLDPALMAGLTGNAILAAGTRPCSACGKPFPIKGKQTYCTAACARKAHRKQNRENMRKRRG